MSSEADKQPTFEQPTAEGDAVDPAAAPPPATATEPQPVPPPGPPPEHSHDGSPAASAAERPEVQIGAAFAGGFVAALILKRLGH